MRIGLIGAGAVAGLHAAAAARLPGLELTAVCDLDPVAADAVAAAPNAPRFTDYRALLASGLTDAIIVNTPHALHLEMTLAALATGNHVLVEKPLAITVADCGTLIDAAATAGRILQVGHIQHFLPDKVAAAAAIAAGRIGEVRLIHDLRGTDYRPGARSDWFFSPEVAGGGALMNIGAHCLDRVTWFAGAPVETISAHAISRFGVAVETDALVQLSFAGGIEASVQVISDLPSYADQVTVVGSAGSITASPLTGTQLRRDGASEVLQTPNSTDIPEAFLAQLANFHAATMGDAATVSLDQARLVVELIRAAYTSSAAGGTPCQIPPHPTR